MLNKGIGVITFISNIYVISSFLWYIFYCKYVLVPSNYHFRYTNKPQRKYTHGWSCTFVGHGKNCFYSTTNFDTCCFNSRKSNSWWYNVCISRNALTLVIIYFKKLLISHHIWFFAYCRIFLFLYLIIDLMCFYYIVTHII